MKYIILIAVVTSSGCATWFPMEKRKLTFVEQTGEKKAQTYSRTLAWLGRNVSDGDFSLKLNDKDNGKLIVKGQVICNELRRSTDAKNYFLAFNLDFQSKDNRARFLFKDLKMLDRNGSPVLPAYNQINGPEKLEAVKPCLKSFRAGVLREVASKKDDSW